MYKIQILFPESVPFPFFCCVNVLVSEGQALTRNQLKVLVSGGAEVAWGVRWLLHEDR